MNPLLLDPTRTVTLRRSFCKGLNRLFRRLKSELLQLVVGEDAFGLSGQLVRPSPVLVNDPTRNSHRPQQSQGSCQEGSRRDGKVSPTTNKRWAYKSNEEAAEQFEKWLKGEVRKELLSEAEALRWRRYVARGFEVGANRALNDVRRGRGKGAKTTRFLDASRSQDFVEGQREAFLRTTLQKSTAAEKLRLLQSSALSEVRGLSDDLVAKGRRIVVDSLVRNLSPREIAERLSKTLDVSTGRARTIANTELVRAHAEGQLEAMAQLGVERVGVAVEWSSMSSACSLCSPLNHVVLKLSEARGMLPRHPNCRCAWTLANVAEDKNEKRAQKRSKTKVDKAIARSKREGSGNDDWGPSVPISRERPKPVTNEGCGCSEHLLTFSELLSSLGEG